MHYEWDADKARRNARKHGVDFADDAMALEDPLAFTVEDSGLSDEKRLATLGVDPAGQLLVVVWAGRANRIRIISARTATRREWRHYEGT